jgi:hypothetical protein
MRSSKKSAPLHTFRVHKSRLLKRLLWFLHLLAVVAAVANSLAWYYQLISVMLVALSLLHGLRRYHYRFQAYSLCYAESGWSIALQENEFQPMQILPSTVITTLGIVLHVRLNATQRLNLFIPRDALARRDYKALIIALKTGWRKEENL